jgi:hypothetical protein
MPNAQRDLMSICKLVSIDVTTFMEQEDSEWLLQPRSVTTEDYLRKEAIACCCFSSLERTYTKPVSYMTRRHRDPYESRLQITHSATSGSLNPIVFATDKIGSCPRAYS